MPDTKYTRDQLYQARTFKTVRRPGVALELGTATFNIFTIANSPVLVASLFGYCTELIAGAALPRLQFTPTVGVETPLCAAAADIDTDAIGTLYSWDGLAASQLIPSAVLGAMGLIATSEWDGKFIILAPGVINVTDATAAAVTGGLIDWYITYLPLLDTGVITAA